MYRYTRLTCRGSRGLIPRSKSLLGRWEGTGQGACSSAPWLFSLGLKSTAIAGHVKRITAMTTNERGLFESLAVFAAALSALGVFMTVYDAVQPGPQEPKICRDAESLQRVPCRFTGERNAAIHDYSNAALRPPINKGRPSEATTHSAPADQAVIDLAHVVSQKHQ